jgi:hypothetical protein
MIGANVLRSSDARVGQKLDTRKHSSDVRSWVGMLAIDAN